EDQRGLSTLARIGPIGLRHLERSLEALERRRRVIDLALEALRGEEVTPLLLERRLQVLLVEAPQDAVLRLEEIREVFDFHVDERARIERILLVDRLEERLVDVHLPQPARRTAGVVEHRAPGERDRVHEQR